MLRADTGARHAALAGWFVFFAVLGSTLSLGAGASRNDSRADPVRRPRAPAGDYLSLSRQKCTGRGRDTASTTPFRSPSLLFASLPFSSHRFASRLASSRLLLFSSLLFSFSSLLREAHALRQAEQARRAKTLAAVAAAQELARHTEGKKRALQAGGGEDDLDSHAGVNDEGGGKRAREEVSSKGGSV